ncbi:multiple epidermal growth factor-like domains protein 10 [Anneissia japonica]|uniref:multiple epidermal growth factor-like domains protein 10 n=1 Tax=Anneissia japonica TaxID=1529436 RepID=UPI001425757A|nr:multiple epidermal growth factor-like domains protein 10 [Anneissia japonica]
MDRRIIFFIFCIIVGRPCADKIPDITAFSSSFIVDDITTTKLRVITGKADGVNTNVMFGIGLWVDDNGTHYGENELINLEHDLADSIFTSGTVFQECRYRAQQIRCSLTFPSSVGVRRVGVKYLWTEFSGHNASTSMVFLAKEATVLPQHRTITTSIGETVHLVMILNGDNANSLRWKKDGGSDIMEWEGLSNVSLKIIGKKDAGIYECYPEGRRHLGQHAILRLLVRGCPRGKWLPPDCGNDCPVCYNGGVCSVQFGSCICPPGFTGDNCQNACGHNNWGRDCTIKCSSARPGCPGVLFCPPDPFGCSCMSGYCGLDCRKVCDTGTTGKYGPGCLLDCHCDAIECQPSEGCNADATCHAGYTGTRCLECDTGASGKYGPGCLLDCHCNANECQPSEGCNINATCHTGYTGTRCLANDCGNLDNIENGMTSYTGTTFGMNTTYTCNIGYNINGVMIRTCEATGLWSGSPPTCEVVSCGDPGSIINGIRMGANETYGSIVTYVCNTGYNLLGAASVTCQPEGTWSQSAPVCQVVNCGIVSVGEGVFVNGGIFTYNAVLMFICDRGYNTVSGDTTRTCQADGNWSGNDLVCEKKSKVNISGLLIGISVLFVLLVIGVALYRRYQLKHKNTLLSQNITHTYAETGLELRYRIHEYETRIHSPETPNNQLYQEGDDGSYLTPTPNFVNHVYETIPE